MPKTKIICTLGPKSDSKSELVRLIQSGMSMARLNFSHGTYEHHEKMIKNLRKAEKKLKKHITIIVDLQGPKIRIGELSKPIFLKRSQEIILTTNIIQTGESQKIPIQYKSLPSEIKTGDHILIDDGLIDLVVLSKTKTDIKCKVCVSGKISSHKGINAPDTNLKAIKTITEKDKKDLEFALQFHPEYVALSFVKNAKDIIDLRKFITKQLSKFSQHNFPKIISKIECQQGIKNLEKIIKISDMVMVARGDLAVEVGDEKVPVLQRKIIELSRKYKKPVIVATQMLSSMIDNARPTRAEASDIARAVFEKADIVMLSNETSVGKYPFKAAHMMKLIIREAEKIV